jgi:RNA polymerase sigma-70 factor (ECF subfamily)
MAGFRRPMGMASAVDGPLRRATDRDAPEAFENLVAPYYPALVRRLVLVLGNAHDAEDVAQDAYLAAFRSWGRFEGGDVRAWLYTIALRRAFNQLRSRRRLLAAVRRIESPPVPAPADPDLWAAVQGLDVRPRTALLLNIVDGYTQAEIGRILGVPEGTVASWLSRARSSLRARLQTGD